MIVYIVLESFNQYTPINKYSSICKMYPVPCLLKKRTENTVSALRFYKISVTFSQISRCGFTQFFPRSPLYFPALVLQQAPLHQ
jgi:hypothetical protein